MLFSFKKNSAEVMAGAVLDVSPGRVDLAIVVSDETKPTPEIVWTHSEDLKTTSAVEVDPLLKKAINNAFSELISAGLKSLRQVHPSVTLDLVQVAIAAPYSYTIPRTISLKNEKPFAVTKKLIQELEKKAEDEALKIQATGLTKNLSLSPLSNSTVTLSINGYPTRYPFKSTATELTLCQMITFAPTDLVSVIENVVNKHLPSAVLDMDSCMSLFFKAISVLVPKNTDACLIDISDSATELCVVREGLPITSVSMPFGLEKLGQSIRNTSGLTASEARDILKDNGVNNSINQSDDKKSLISSEINNFIVELKKLLGQTGDSLSLPKTIYLHVDRMTESFFVATLEREAREITGIKHTVAPVTSKFFTFGKDGDSATACSAYIFHKKLYEDNYLEG